MKVTKSQSSQQPGGAHQLRSRLLDWLVLVLVSGAGSLTAVHLATPLTVDEFVTGLVLFFLLPGLLICAAGLSWRPAGGVIALVIPFCWLAIAFASDDSPWLWLVPVATALVTGLILTAARTHDISRANRGRQAVTSWLGLGTVLAVTAFLLPGPGQPGSGTRLLLFGLDGGTWNLIDELVAEGRMPNFARALESGHRARLRSLPSTLSPQVWTSIATGYPPSIHGAWDFASNRDQVQVGRVWDQLHLEDRSFGLCGWYFTWPPLPGLGDHHFVVPSPLAPAGDTHPADFNFFWQIWTGENPRQGGSVNYLAAGLQAFRHGVRISTLRKAGVELVTRRLKPRSEFDQEWRSRALSAELQADISAELIRTRRPEFVALLFTQVDRVSHKYWKFMEPGGFPDLADADLARYRTVIADAYATADRHLGSILQHCPDDVDLLIVSDHGFQAGLGQWAGSWCSIRSEPLLQALNLTQEISATHVSDQLLLRPLRRTGAAADSLLIGLQEVLDQARIIGDDRPLFAWDREEATLNVRLAPRNAIPEHATILLAGGQYLFEELMHAGIGASWSGEHHPDGIYLLSGPAAARALPTDSLHVLDVAPTLSALLDLPQCPGWTGSSGVTRPPGSPTVLAEYPQPPEAGVDGTAVDEILREKLRAIGYVR